MTYYRPMLLFYQILVVIEMFGKKKKSPTLILEFDNEEKLIEFMAQCSKYNIITEDVNWLVDNISTMDKEHFFSRLKQRVIELRGEE